MITISSLNKPLISLQAAIYTKTSKKYSTLKYENEANSFDDHEMEKNCNLLSDRHYGNVVTLRIHNTG